MRIFIQDYFEEWNRDTKQRGRFCQIVFHRLEEPCETCYVGRRMDE